MEQLALRERESIVRARLGLTSNHAAAYAARDVDVDVIAAYPITPQTPTVEKIAEFVANGEIRAEYIPVESEHSAMSALIGASAAGARTFTATSSQGLFYMYELLYIASGLRLPIVMAIASRAASAPICIHGDYQDVMSMRDTGWIMIIASSAQEVYDSIIMAYRIAEDQRVLLPVAVAFDGFLMSHTTEPVELYHEEYVRKFTPKNLDRLILDSSRPITMGAMAVPDWYYEIKYQVIHAMNNSIEVIGDIHREFNNSFGRSYGFVESYMLEDAEEVVVTYGGIWGDVKRGVRMARKDGIKAGALRIRLLRPFPARDIVMPLSNAKTVIVLDRAVSPGATVDGPLALEIATALKLEGIDVRVISAIHGLGQRTVYARDVYEVLKSSHHDGIQESRVYLGVREYGSG
ncbi:ferredoxin oxidoreductase [Vulcanisaeta sp. EB80]|uniref:ferredoxin oxidoreductase n=1 Tax=Vulcanisaeta sp. EB80 TaxID=1650660 RepID=UPI0009BF8490|nr:ferredoxin oxidoreductase [Vulcanisaeta sp. EB80]PLC64979.1 ferredoxin oxidoreductase [Vulcanisaeta sp. EB80]